VSITTSILSAPSPLAIFLPPQQASLPYLDTPQECSLPNAKVCGLYLIISGTDVWLNLSQPQHSNTWLMSANIAQL